MANEKDPLLDFRNFLFAIWKHLVLPAPSPLQYDIAQFLNDETVKRKCVEAFRGIGKSWITDTYIAFRLYKNKNERILLVSASAQKAEQSLRFIKQLITDVPFLKHLSPQEGERNTVKYFDVFGADPAEAPSVRAAGITGQITGARASLIVADDVEIPKNALTPLQREHLAEAIKEFDAILSPGGSIVYLGTPQTEHSIYNLLPDRGYTIRIWPARYPAKADLETTYGSSLSKFISSKAKDSEGLPTEPTRFTEQELFTRELSYGRSGFRLQFMLDTRLTDANRYPLRLSDLVVLDIDNDLAPQKVIWGSTNNLHLKELQSVGLSGDKLFSPQFVSDIKDWLPYTGSVLAIDPSGRGKDETAYCVLKFLNGYLFIQHWGGLLGGYTPDNLQFLANIARDSKVNKVLIESNFGDGMFQQLLHPYLVNTYPVSIEEVRSSIQKEKRIIDTLEPIFNQHRLVLNKSIVNSDILSTQAYDDTQDNSHQYQALYQLTRITREKASLAHDDRIDCLALAAAHFTSQMRIDANKAIKKHQDKLFDAQIQSFLKSHSRVWGNSNKPSFTVRV